VLASLALLFFPPFFFLVFYRVACGAVVTMS
jgi:hypothetical protein